MNKLTSPARTGAPGRKVSAPPRLGFLGLGWIGRMRLGALVDARLAEACALADTDPGALAEAAALAPGAKTVDSLPELLAQDLDGLVIATPSAQHAEQAAHALEAGLAVFCQKPLGRTGAEAAALADLARRADRPLGVDYSYRYLGGMAEVRAGIQEGRLGRVFAADLLFHNAYGPDKPWFHDLAQAGGGCLLDLGTHLLDLTLWCLGWPAVERLDGRLFAAGRPLPRPSDRVEDYAVVSLDLAGGVHARLACSWNLAAGCDALIGAAFYGTEGAYVLRNVEGSYYDFVIDRMQGTRGERLAGPPDAWGGRALIDWVGRIARGEGCDRGEDLTAVPRLLDRAYGRSPAES